MTMKLKTIMAVVKALPKKLRLDEVVALAFCAMLLMLALTIMLADPSAMSINR